jgi:hypothetical protein
LGEVAKVKGMNMQSNRRHWIQIIGLLIPGALWLLRGLICGDIAATSIGLAISSSSASLILTAYVTRDFKAKRYLEIISLAGCLGIIIYGYILSGTIILMIMAAFIIALFALGVTLSYIMPKIRGGLEAASF